MHWVSVITVQTIRRSLQNNLACVRPPRLLSCIPYSSSTHSVAHSPLHVFAHRRLLLHITESKTKTNIIVFKIIDGDLVSNAHKLHNYITHYAIEVLTHHSDSLDFSCCSCFFFFMCEAHITIVMYVQSCCRCFHSFWWCLYWFV